MKALRKITFVHMLIVYLLTFLVLGIVGMTKAAMIHIIIFPLIWFIAGSLIEKK